jgi:DMSO/TMAO reductase YedYZ molybdopterin-dependent catalytic subunit
MSIDLTRRKIITAGVVTAAGAAGLGVAAQRYLRLPPDYASLQGAGETLTYSVQRLLTSSRSLAREFPPDMISKVAIVNGRAPKDEQYQRWLTNSFDGWQLKIEGQVARPASFTLRDLRQMPQESHTILHACEQGWSFIAKWTGVRLSHLLDLAQTRPNARYCVLVPVPNPQERTGIVRLFWDSIDMADATHPQTLIAYGMNDGDLPPDHGAPVRLRMSRQLGYKNVKFLSRIIVTDNIAQFGVRGGPGTWYGGI